MILIISSAPRPKLVFLESCLAQIHSLNYASVMRVAYVNGEYIPYHLASVPMEDRGYQFADGIYEVVMFYNRRFLDWDLHMARFDQSLLALRIVPPMTRRALELVVQRLLACNDYANGSLYMQVTRGVAKRNHLFPKHTRPSLTMTIMPLRPAAANAYTDGVKVITLPDERWGRCDIKSIALLPNVLARQSAYEQGAAEAFLFNADGHLTEGSLSTAYIVKHGTVMTHPESHAVLPGVRKHIIRRLCADAGIAYIERMIPQTDVMTADEAFITSANTHVLPVTRIDETVISGGKAGAITLALLARYQAHVTEQTGKSW
jgi:D-alanine transaminase